MSDLSFIVDNRVRDEVLAFIDLLIKNKFSPGKVILFGSYAKNRQHEYSDVDLAVVSDKFTGEDFDELLMLNKLSSKVSSRIEAIPFNDRNFELSRYDTLIGEVKKYGKIVYENP